MDNNKLMLYSFCYKLAFYRETYDDIYRYLFLKGGYFSIFLSYYFMVNDIGVLIFHIFIVPCSFDEELNTDRAELCLCQAPHS